MVIVSGGFQCVSHVAPSTTRDEGSIADYLSQRLRHDLGNDNLPLAPRTDRPLHKKVMLSSLSKQLCIELAIRV